MCNQYLNKLKKVGYCKISKYFKDREIKRLKYLIKKHYVKKKYIGLPARDKNDKILYNLQNKDKYFIKILQKPLIKNICRSLLDDEHFRLINKKRPNYILGFYNARSSGEKLDLHIDSHMPYLGNRIYKIQVAIILEDQNQNNGCTIIVPKSHQSGTFCDRKTKKIKHILSKKGDVVIWDSRTWHGTTKNISKHTRWSIIATFSTWWLKQSMDMVRSLPKKIFNQLTLDEKIMLGYCAVIPKDENGILRTKRKITEIKYIN